MPADQTNKKGKDVRVEERESSGASCGEWERLFGDFWAAGVISCFLGILEGFSVAIYFRKKNIPFEQWKQDPWLFRVYVGDDMLPIYMVISLETIT